jgi:hypothetical protein
MSGRKEYTMTIKKPPERPALGAALRASKREPEPLDPEYIPPISTFPGRQPVALPGQLTLDGLEEDDDDVV